jgi:hypothetical protein
MRGGPRDAAFLRVLSSAGLENRPLVRGLVLLIGAVSAAGADRA